MSTVVIVLSLLLIATIGVAFWLLFERSRTMSQLALEEQRASTTDLARQRAEAELTDARRALDAAEREMSTLAQERARLIERLDAFERSRQQYESELEKQLINYRELFKKTIESATGEAMKSSADHLVSRAKQIFDVEQQTARTILDARVQPISESLRKTGEKLQEIEKERIDAYGRLASELSRMAEAGTLLRQETSTLVAALRKPQVRGRYGEVQLQRVAELAGMREYVDFSTQHSTRDDEGRARRPDMVVRLPNGRTIAIDAKTNIEAYLDAIESSDPAQAERHLDRFARHVSDQATALAKKDYWSEIPGSLDFVVMFIPGDQFIDAALQRRADLLEAAAQQGVILASPSTLIGLLRAVHVGWREKRISDEAKNLFDLGRELHKRAAVAFDHAEQLGRSLGKAAERYNDFVGSIERQMLPTLRKFEEAGADSEKEIPDLAAITTTIRRFTVLPRGSSGSDAPPELENKQADPEEPA